MKRNRPLVINAIIVIVGSFVLAGGWMSFARWERSQNDMICPGNPEHTGIEVVKSSIAKGIISPHYAKAICAECHVWIKWLSRKQADAIDAGKEIPYGIELPDHIREDIREIVRQEIEYHEIEYHNKS